MPLPLIEVILCVLLTSFSFGLTDEAILWNTSVVTYPTMGEESTKPELSLKVKKL